MRVGGPCGDRVCGLKGRRHPRKDSPSTQLSFRKRRPPACSECAIGKGHRSRVRISADPRSMRSPEFDCPASPYRERWQSKDCARVGGVNMESREVLREGVQAQTDVDQDNGRHPAPGQGAENALAPTILLLMRGGASPWKSIGPSGMKPPTLTSTSAMNGTTAYWKQSPWPTSLSLTLETGFSTFCGATWRRTRSQN